MPDDLEKLLGQRFIERRDVKAWQFPGGGYTPDRTKLSLQDLRDHVSGKRTMGHYLVSHEDRCRIFVFDIDLVKDLVIDGETIHPRELLHVRDSPHRERLVGDLTVTAEVLARRTHKLLGIPVAISFSGSKGVHVTGFTGADEAATVRGLALEVMNDTKLFEPLRGVNFFKPISDLAVEVEVFPKQDSLEGKDLGNLVRLPMGVNKKSGKPSMFLKLSGGERSSFTVMDPIEALSGNLPW